MCFTSRSGVNNVRFLFFSTFVQMKNLKFLRILVLAQLFIILALLAFLVIQFKSEAETTIFVQVEHCVKAKTDLAIWRGTISVRHTDLVQANEQLERNRERVFRNFTAKGIVPEAIEFLPVQTQIDSNSIVLVQYVEVQTTDLSRIKKVATESSELLKFKVDFSAEEPRFRIANFTAWLLEQIPSLLVSARQHALALAGKDKKISGVKHFRLIPISDLAYSTCINLEATKEADDMHVLLALEVEFVVR